MGIKDIRQVIDNANNGNTIDLMPLLVRVIIEKTYWHKIEL